MQQPNLAILIPTFIGREKYLQRLMDVLMPQIEVYKKDIQLFILGDNRERTTGWKRNKLTEMAVDAGCTYRAFVDDDDMLSTKYIQKQLEVVNSGKDCGSLMGSIYFSGVKGKPFHHSIKHGSWFETPEIYARCPNHLNCIKLDIAKRFPFLDQVFGEDAHQSLDMFASGLLKTEHEINEVIYHYFTGIKETMLELEIIKKICE